MTNPTYMCCMEAESAAENDKWERVGWEGEKPVSVLQFIWSFISERERDRWRNMEKEGKAAEQKESRDFQRKRLSKINKYFLFFTLTGHTYATSLYLSHAIRFYFAMTKSETTSNTSERPHQ